MANIEKQSLLKKESLSRKAYLESLLAEGERAGLLTERDTARVQTDCLELLAKKLEQRYGKRSSSVPEEYAEELLESILYTLSLALKTAPAPETALVMLNETPIPFLYTAGLRVNRLLLRDIRVLAGAVRESRIPCANPFYATAAGKSLFAFLTQYQPDTKAHVHDFMPVYTVEHPIRDLVGAEYVREYAKALFAENRFCSLFAPEDLAAVLNTPAGKTENLFHTVLRAAAVRLLTVGSLNGLRVTEEDLLTFRSVYASRGADALAQALHKAFAEAFGTRVPYVEKSIRALALELAKPAR